MALVSVIIPVFNRPGAARRATRSALSQADLGADTLEIVLVDDGSSPPLRLPDVTAAVQVLRLEPNCGPAAARNAGVRAARGDYIAFLDSDDVWLPGKLASQLRDLRRLAAVEPNIVVASACGFYYPNRQSGRLEARMPMAGNSAIAFASGCWSAPGTTLVVPRAVFDRVGLLDESLRRLEDYDWLLRFGLAGGRLETTDTFGAVIAPSGLARPAIVDHSVAHLIAKYGTAGLHPLPPRLARRFAAYMALEKAAALLGEGRCLAGALHLVRSVAMKPRLSGSVCAFWKRSADVPADVVAMYDSVKPV